MNSVACLAILLTTLSPTQVKKQIQAQYDRWSKAYMAQDVDTLVGILAPDYSLTSSDGKVSTHDGYVAYLRLKKRTGYKDPFTTQTTIVGLQMSGAQAKVDAQEIMTSQVTDPTTQKPETCIHSHYYLDIWQRFGSVWRLKSTKTLRESTTYKPLPFRHANLFGFGRGRGEV